jgi:uncharacterized protein (DUF952 family)
MEGMGMKNWRKGEESGGYQAERRQKGSIHLSRYSSKRTVENAAVHSQSALSLDPFPDDLLVVTTLTANEKTGN